MVWKQILKRVNNFLVRPTEKEKETYLVQVQVEYVFDCFQVRFGLVVSAVWIGSECGFVILLLLDACAQRAIRQTVLGQCPSEDKTY